MGKKQDAKIGNTHLMKPVVSRSAPKTNSKIYENSHSPVVFVFYIVHSHYVTAFLLA